VGGSGLLAKPQSARSHRVDHNPATDFSSRFEGNVGCWHISPVCLDVWPEFKARAAACYQAASPALARLLRDDFRATYGRDLPSATACLEDDFEACIAHLRFPLGHRRAIRTTNLLERLFGEERRRTKVIPHAFGERVVLNLMFAALIRAAERWRGIRITEFEQRQLRAIQAELNTDFTARNAPAMPASQSHLSSNQRTDLASRCSIVRSKVCSYCRRNKVALQVGESASNSASCGTKMMINPMIRIPNQPTRDTRAQRPVAPRSPSPTAATIMRAYQDGRRIGSPQSFLPVCGFGFALAVRFNGRNCSWKSITSAIGPPSRRAGDAGIE
jgi:hypothetical protein